MGLSFLENPGTQIDAEKAGFTQITKNPDFWVGLISEERILSDFYASGWGKVPPICGRKRLMTLDGS
jgi:hypothetical protein